MTTVSPPAGTGGETAGSVRSEAAVLAATAVGGVLAVVIWLAWSYSYEVGHRSGSTGHHVAPLPYWSQFLLIPLVAFAGGRFAPRRQRAAVIAACAGQVILAFVTKASFFLEPTRFALDLWVGELVLVGLAWAAAAAGAAVSRR